MVGCAAVMAGALPNPKLLLLDWPPTWTNAFFACYVTDLPSSSQVAQRQRTFNVDCPTCCNVHHCVVSRCQTCTAQGLNSSLLVGY